MYVFGYSIPTNSAVQHGTNNQDQKTEAVPERNGWCVGLSFSLKIKSTLPPGVLPAIPQVSSCLRRRPRALVSLSLCRLELQTLHIAREEQLPRIRNQGRFSISRNRECAMWPNNGVCTLAGMVPREVDSFGAWSYCKAKCVFKPKYLVSGAHKVSLSAPDSVRFIFLREVFHTPLLAS